MKNSNDVSSARWPALILVAGAALVALAGCTSFTTPDGTRYENNLFSKSFEEAQLETYQVSLPWGMKIVRVRTTLKGAKSEADRAWDTVAKFAPVVR